MLGLGSLGLGCVCVCLCELTFKCSTFWKQVLVCMTIISMDSLSLICMFFFMLGWMNKHSESLLTSCLLVCLLLSLCFSSVCFQCLLFDALPFHKQDWYEPQLWRAGPLSHLHVFSCFLWIDLLTRCFITASLPVFISCFFVFTLILTFTQC